MSKFGGLGIQVDTPTRMTVMHPVTRRPLVNSQTGEEAWVDLIAADSAVGRAFDRQLTDRLIKMRGRTRSADEIEEDNTSKLARLTKAWSLMTLDGEPIDVECTEANANELYAMGETSWLKSQVLEFVFDAGNFRRRTSPN